MALGIEGGIGFSAGFFAVTPGGDIFGAGGGGGLLFPLRAILGIGGGIGFSAGCFAVTPGGAMFGSGASDLIEPLVAKLGTAGGAPTFDPRIPGGGGVFLRRSLGVLDKSLRGATEGFTFTPSPENFGTGGGVALLPLFPVRVLVVEAEIGGGGGRNWGDDSAGGVVPLDRPCGGGGGDDELDAGLTSPGGGG